MKVKLLISFLMLEGAAFAVDTTTTAGNPAPNFSLKDATGKTVTLKNYRGKLLLLDFWATCTGCK
jgi:peroxiredoxin